jgi:GT2 family glycosyltransferase
VGNGTFGDKPDSKEEIIKINDKILESIHGMKIEHIYQACLIHKCDINELFPILRRYASRCERVTEFGVRGVFSTYALIAAMPSRLTSYDVETSQNILEAMDVANEIGVAFTFEHKNVLEIDIDETDMLFIDTLHTCQQLGQELEKHHSKVRKYIVMHDTFTWGNKDEIEVDYPAHGLIPAINRFLEFHREWVVCYDTQESNGLVILERVPGYSIIIPTNNKRKSLQDCLESVFAYTDMKDKEVIVVANGCDAKTMHYLYSNEMRRKIRVVNGGPQEIGVMKAYNDGVVESSGNKLIFLDDDCLLLDQSVDKWVKLLEDPFCNNNTGMTSVFPGIYPGIGVALHSGCCMIPRDLFMEMDGFDESFQKGYLGDTDMSLRIKKAGLDIVAVGTDGQFPIYHPDSSATTQVKLDNQKLMKINRRLLYERHNRPEVSIVIPTYNHCEDLLKPCIEGLIKHTDLSKVEVIVVANGCRDNTKEYVQSLGHPFVLIWEDEGLGYTKATNLGIKQALGEFVVLLNNDIVLLDHGHPKHTWIEMLKAPFVDEKVGVTGPLMLHDDYSDRKVMIGFCMMVRAKLFDVVGLLDEIYSPGGGEDIDICCKIEDAGYKQVVVPNDNVVMTWTNCGSFPLFHRGEGTFTTGEFPEYGSSIIKINGMKNMLKYNKHIKLNLGCGGVSIPGYIGVDKFDSRAHIVMDVTNLELPENSVEEIQSLHMLEHISPYKVTDLLKSWLRILKPGGKLVLELPNIEELCKDFVSGTKAERYGILNCFFCPLNTTGTGDPNEATSPHLWGWYPEILEEHLRWAGFDRITFLPEQFPHPIIPRHNFRTEAYKPS